MQYAWVIYQPKISPKLNVECLVRTAQTQPEAHYFKMSQIWIDRSGLSSGISLPNLIYSPSFDGIH